MMSIHLLIGLIEGFITMAVIGYLRQVRGDILSNAIPGKLWLSHKMVLITLLAITLITATGLSILASGKPDGLEYSYAERPDDDSFEPIVSNESTVITAVDNLHAKISPMPDYSPRTSTTDSEIQPDISAGWTSLAGIVGSLLTMATVWLIARLLRKKQSPITI